MIAGDRDIDLETDARLWRHDMRNDLGAILGYGELVLEQTREAGRPDWVAAARAMVEEGRRALSQLERAREVIGDRRPSPEELADLRNALGEPMDAIHDQCRALRADAGELLGPDLDCIEEAARRLVSRAE